MTKTTSETAAAATSAVLTTTTMETMTMTIKDTTEATPEIKKVRWSPERKVALKIHIRSDYFTPEERDKEFNWHLKQIADNIAARRAGAGLKQCALVVIGTSGTGKSQMLAHCVSKMQEFQPPVDSKGDLYSSVLWSEAPASCNTKAIAISLLAALGVKASSRASEFQLHSVLKRVLKANGIELVVIDELQHAFRGTKEATIKKVQDVFKSLLQIDDWPIHFIFAGTPDLARFLEGDRQLANRCRVMRLTPLRHKKADNVAFAQSVIDHVVGKIAGLDIGWCPKDNLPQRLVRSASGAFGTMIQTIQEACFRAIDDNRATVMLNDFAAVYKANTGCIKRDNVFTSPNWETINPAKAVADLTEDQ